MANKIVYIRKDNEEFVDEYIDKLGTFVNEKIEEEREKLKDKKPRDE